MSNLQRMGYIVYSHQGEQVTKITDAGVRDLRPMHVKNLKAEETMEENKLYANLAGISILANFKFLKFQFPPTSCVVCSFLFFMLLCTISTNFHKFFFFCANIHHDMMYICMHAA